MAVGVERSYSPEDVQAIWDFVYEGGNVIIADDFGHGNSLWKHSEGLGLGEVPFYNEQLFDPNYIKNTKFVTVNATLGNRRYNLMLNEPSALVKREGLHSSTTTETIAKSSEESWLDSNKNGVRDPSEFKNSYDVIVFLSESNFKGKMLVISDPGLFINDNWNQLDNARFIVDVVNYFLPDGGEVVFDESRHINENTFENSRNLVYSGIVYLTSTIWSLFIFVILIIICTLIIGVRIKPQRPWRNRNLLETKFLNILNYPYIGSNDYWLIKNTLLEKVRLGYGFTPEEFKELDVETSYKLLGDRYLWDFITQRFPSYQTDYYYYQSIVRRIIDWTPRRPEQQDKPPESEGGIKDGETPPESFEYYNKSQHDESSQIRKDIKKSEPGDKIPINKFLQDLDDDTTRRF